MTRRQTCFTILLTTITLLTFGQTPKIKRVTEIRYEYGTTFDLTIDTIIREYDINGNQIVPFNLSNTSSVTITFPIKTETVDSTQSIIHRQQFWSDSSIKDIYQLIYKDSIVTLLTDNQDTVYKKVERTRRNKPIEESTTFYRKSDTPRLEYYIVDKDNFLVKETTSITVDNHYEFNDTTKVRYNKICHVRKKYSYNYDKNEWFVVKKEKFNTKGRLKETIDQFYNESQEEYFKTKTKLHYSNLGQKDSEIVYDCNLKVVEKKSFYDYF